MYHHLTSNDSQVGSVCLLTSVQDPILALYWYHLARRCRCAFLLFSRGFHRHHDRVASSSDCGGNLDSLICLLWCHPSGKGKRNTQLQPVEGESLGSPFSQWCYRCRFFFFSVVSGYSMTVIFWKFSALLNCHFPNPLTRESPSKIWIILYPLSCYPLLNIAHQTSLFKLLSPFFSVCSSFWIIYTAKFLVQ